MSRKPETRVWKYRESRNMSCDNNIFDDKVHNHHFRASIILSMRQSGTANWAAGLRKQEVLRYHAGNQNNSEEPLGALDVSIFYSFLKLFS